MNFVYHIVGCSRTKHSNKRIIIKLWFFLWNWKLHFSGNHFDDLIALIKSVFRGNFLYKILMLLPKVSLFSVVIPSIFSSLLSLKIKLLKISVWFSSKHFETQSKSKRRIFYISSRLQLKAYKVFSLA